MSKQITKIEAEDYAGGNLKITKLYYDGRWVLRTTETGIETNPKIAWYVIAVAYTKYLWYKVRDWLNTPLRGATFVAVFTAAVMGVLWYVY